MSTARRSAAGTVLMNSHLSRARVEDPGRPAGLALLVDGDLRPDGLPERLGHAAQPVIVKPLVVDAQQARVPMSTCGMPSPRSHSSAAASSRRNRSCACARSEAPLARNAWTRPAGTSKRAAVRWIRPHVSSVTPGKNSDMPEAARSGNPGKGGCGTSRRTTHRASPNPTEWAGLDISCASASRQ